MDLDNIDKAFVDALVPEGALPTGLFAVVTWLDGDGEPNYRYYNQTDTRVFEMVGMLESVKLSIMQDAAEFDDEDEDGD